MSQGIILSTQHEEFVNEYFFGDNKGVAAQCYANVYNGGVMKPSFYSNASKLLVREDVSKYIAVLQEEQSKLAKLRKVHNTEVLTSIIDEMSTATPTDHNGNPISAHLCRQTAIAAVREQNKMLGLNEEKADLTVNGGMNFTFNLIPPSDADEVDVEAEMKDIRFEKGDFDAEDIEFEESNEQF